MILLFDGNNQAHMAFHSTGQNLANGTAFGLLRMMRATMIRFSEAKPVFVWDGGLNQERLELYPDYKKKREGITTTAPEEEKELFFEQIKLFRFMLDILGVQQVKVKEQEADDIIGILTKQFEERGEQAIIVSNDNDFHQLLSRNISIFNPIKKARFTFESFEERYPDLTTEQFISVKSIMGDNSDNIPGVKGLGEKRAVQIIQMIGNIANLPDERLNKRGKTFARLNEPENVELVQRNYQLIGINRANRIGVELPPGGKPKLDDFFEMMRQLDFKSILNQEEDWRKMFTTPERRQANAFDFF